MIGLRDYQVTAQQAVLAGWGDGRLAQMVVLPTGAGKTITALSIVEPDLVQGRRVLWIAHRTELLRQPLDEWNVLWPGVARAGIVQAERRDGIDAQLAFASVNTIQRVHRLNEILAHGDPAVVVWDEAHHAASPTWRRIRGLLDSRNGLRHLGLTATPERTDGRALGGEAGFEIAHQLLLSQAVAAGYLVPLSSEVIRLPELDLRKLKSGEDGDYIEHELAEALMKAEVVEHTANAIMNRAPARRGLIFTCSVDQAEKTAAALRKRGIAAESIHGNLSDTVRARRLDAHKRGELQWLANCAILTEGYNDTGIDAIVVARPTRSRPLYIQQVGRGLRLHPGKSGCLVLDLAGASNEHSMITAAVLLEEDALRGGEVADRAEQRRRSAYRGMYDARGRSRYAWLPVHFLDREAFVGIHTANGARQPAVIV